MEVNEITDAILGAATRVHRKLGPGLLESPYKVCLGAELAKDGLRFEREVPVPVDYDGMRLDCGYRLDLLVERKVVVEVKSVAALDPIFVAQVLTYLRLGGFEAGLLINFNTKFLGPASIRRLVNGYSGPLPRVPRVPR
jgi:GxxExxY protein